MKMKLSKHILISSFLVLSSSLLLHSQTIEETIRPVTNAIAIENATIISKPGTSMQNANIVIKNGVIKSVGTNARIPKNAKKLKGDSLYVYPGFIDALGHIAIPKPKEEENRDRPKSPGMASHKQAGITPELKASTLISAKDKTVAEWRKMGFTSAHTVPKGKMLPGTGALILLKGSTPEEMIVSDASSVYAQLQGSGRGAAPATVIGVIYKYKELYRQATQAKNHESMFSRNSLGAKRPVYDNALKAFYPVIDKKYPVYFRANKSLDIHRVLQMQKELGFPLVLTGVKDGASVASKIKSVNASVLLSTDLPKAIEEKKDDEEKKDEEALSEETKAMTARKNEAIKNAELQFLQFNQQGIKTAFTSSDAKSKEFFTNLKRMKDAGATDDMILAALTTTPAELLGVSNLMGTLDNGKMGNVIVSNKPILEKGAQIKYVIIEGELFEYEIKKKKAKKKGDGGEVSSEALKVLLGDWEYTIDTPDQVRKGALNFSGTADDIVGIISGDDMGGDTELENVSFSDNEITFNFEIEMGPSTATLEVEATVDGDDMSGNMTVGDFGTFPFSANKVSPE